MPLGVHIGSIIPVLELSCLVLTFSMTRESYSMWVFDTARDYARSTEMLVYTSHKSSAMIHYGYKRLLTVAVDAKLPQIIE